MSSNRNQTAICAFLLKKIIVTNAFTKKTQKLPETEKNICITCREDYLQRNEED